MYAFCVHVHGDWREEHQLKNTKIIVCSLEQQL